MTDIEINDWLEQDLSKYENLTPTVVSIIESLLHANSIEYLSVSGRTKTRAGILEKIKRKRYSTPKNELTDISGIRVILYFESQVDRVSKIIEKSFKVDKENSFNRDTALSIDQIGYRSVHYVCDLGGDRTKLPENSRLDGLQFEIQLRTVLQHAWAELAHDRNYKFSGKLPREIERELFLYAGMLEIADKGFDSLSKKIDSHIKEVKAKTDAGDYNMELDSVSLEQFIEAWAKENNLSFMPREKEASRILVQELKDYGLNSVEDLRKIIPKEYAKAAKELNSSNNIYGLLRDWMILNDYERYRDKAWKESWTGFGDDNDRGETYALYERFVGTKRATQIMDTFDFHPQAAAEEQDENV